MTATVRPDRGWNLATFNLIEIILAMVIILLGVVSIMSLFPVGQDATRSAVGRTSAADASDQFLNYVSTKLKSHWAIVGAIPITKPGPDDSGAIWCNDDLGGMITGVEGVLVSYNDMNNDRTFNYDVKTDKDTGAEIPRDNSGLFQIEQRTANKVLDFSGVIRLWSSAATYSSYDAASGAWVAHRAVPPESGIKLNIEISWPATLPYAKREKATYALDVFRPSEANVETVNGAFKINETGTLRVTYYGSDAGWKSSLSMDEPEKKVLFTSNQTTDQNTTWDTEYDAGTTFNFHITTHGQCCGYNDYDHNAYAPPPPTCDCYHRGLAGDININPNNSTSNIFICTTSGGSIINRNTLATKNIVVDSDGTYYSGGATYVQVKPKGNGNQNSLLMDGTVYLLANANTYDITGDPMTVRIYNDKLVNGKAMGHWWIHIETTEGHVVIDGKAHDDRCIMNPTNFVNYNLNGIYYTDNPTSRYSGAIDSISGNPYCLVNTLVPGRKWLLMFEDLPGASADWDYNDEVVGIELLRADGVAAEIQNTPVSGTVVLNNNSNWRVSIAKPDGTMITNNSSDLAYTGPALSIWFRPLGTGTQSISVGGNNTTFDNSQMVSVCSNAMNLNVYKSGTQWKADISTTKGFYTVLK